MIEITEFEMLVWMILSCLIGFAFGWFGAMKGKAMSSWDCPKCDEVNPGSKSACRRCGYERFWYSKTLNAKIRKVDNAK